MTVNKDKLFVCAQALQAQLLQQLAVSGVSGGTASLAHISQQPQQTVAGNNGISQVVQPCASISVVSQQQQQLVIPSSCENTGTSAQQQVVSEDCLNSSVARPASAGGHSTRSDCTQTESVQNSEAGLDEPASADVLESSQVVADTGKVNTQSQPADANQLQQCSCTAESSSTGSVTGPTQSQSTSHSRVIEQLQQQLLRSSAKQTVNGHRVVMNGEKSHTDVVCKAEEGEVDGNELTQFLS